MALLSKHWDFAFDIFVACAESVKMPGLLTECEDLFGTNNLYEVLNIKKDAKEKEGKASNYNDSVLSLRSTSLAQFCAVRLPKLLNTQKIFPSRRQ